MPHFFECGANGDGIAHIEEEAAEFRFSSGGEDGFHDCAVGKNGSIVGG